MSNVLSVYLDAGMVMTTDQINQSPPKNQTKEGKGKKNFMAKVLMTWSGILEKELGYGSMLAFCFYFLALLALVDTLLS